MSIANKLAKPVTEIIEHIAQKVPKALGHGHHRIAQHVHDAADTFDKVEDDVANKAKGHHHSGGGGHHDPHVAAGTGASAAAKAGAGRSGRDASTAVKDAERSARDGDLRAPGQHGDPSIPGEHKHCLSDPVDTATGDMLLTARDVQLPGALPLELERTHLSSYRHGVWFGPTWASTLDQRLQLDAEGVVFAAADGMRLEFPPPQAGRAVHPVKGPRLRLTWSGLAGDPMHLHDPASGRTLEFHLPRPAPGLEGGVTLRLVGVEDRNGRRIDIAYGEDDAPALITHHGGYRIAVDRHPTLPRITALRLLDAGPPRTPAPAGPGGPASPGGSAAPEGTDGPDGTDGSDGVDESRGPGTVLIRYGYDDRGDLVEIATGDGPPARYRYDDLHRIIGWTDRNGTDYAYTYDHAGRVVRTTGSDGILSSTFAYDDATRTTTYTDSLGNSSTYRFNAAYRLVSSTDPLGATTVQEWDADNRLLVGCTDPLGRVTRYAHDRAGNITEAGFPDGSTARFRYDPQGRPVEMTDPAGRVWRTEYDERGNPTASTDPLGARTRYTYDAAGDLVAVTDPLGARHELVHDAAGLPVAVTDPLGRTTTARRDAFGRIVESTDALGGTVRFGFTLEGQVLWCERSDGRRESWTYDAEGNPLTHTDPAGRTTAQAAGHFGLTTASSQAGGSTYAFTHDTEQRLTAVTNPTGQTWSYTYDAAGRLVAETDFQGRTVSYAYDAAGQLVSRTNGAGATVTFTRDLLGRILTQSDADDTTVYVYDAAGNVARTANAHSEIVREFDALDRMLSETVDGQRTSYAYDAVGRIVRQQTPSGVVSTWTFDPAGLPRALDVAGNRLEFTFDALGREVARGNGAGFFLTQSWDATGRLATQTLAGRGAAGPLQHREYRYRPDDLLGEISELSSGTREFALDPSGRITAVRARGWSEDYAYDALGNLTRAATPVDGPHDGSPRDAGPARGAGGREPDDSEREFDGGRLVRAGRVRYAHDEQGRVVRATTLLLDGRRRVRSYTWNATDQLVGVVTPDGATWRYLYDPAGRRIAKQRLTEQGDVAEEIRFSWSGAQLAEQTRADGRTTTWAYAPGTYRPLVQLDRQGAGGTVGTGGEDVPDTTEARFHAVVTDLVGTPTELVTADGEVVWQQRTTLWGLPATDPADDTVDCPLRFPGQYADAETGWHFNYFRHYDPWTARYTTPDPLGLDPAPNAETYVANPYAWIDPLGLASSRYRDLPGWTDGEPDDVTWGGRVSYTGMDVHGRPGAVTATIHKDMLGQNTGPKIRATSIPGWDTAHDLERGHLLAAQLGGSNTIPENFIALHQFSNSPVMRHYENQVAAAVRGGHVVTYTVTPIYRNASDLRPVGVSIHATSPQGFQFSPHSENKKWRREWRKNPDINTIHIVNSCR